jgi:tetratricopeptide (TPR) repeat protein
MKYPMVLVLLALCVFVFTQTCAAQESDQTANPWYWYNKAVDLATEGKFQEALDANDKALAINATMPLALANKAGILVQLGRYEESITAADKAISSESNTPVAKAAAYYSKGDALKALGRIDEAKTAYTEASVLDPALVPPDLSRPATSPTKAPLLWQTAAGAVGIVSLFRCFPGRPRRIYRIFLDLSF